MWQGGFLFSLLPPFGSRTCTSCRFIMYIPTGRPENEKARQFGYNAGRFPARNMRQHVGWKLQLESPHLHKIKTEKHVPSSAHRILLASRVSIADTDGLHQTRVMDQWQGVPGHTEARPSNRWQLRVLRNKPQRWIRHVFLVRWVFTCRGSPIILSIIPQIGHRREEQAQIFFNANWMLPLSFGIQAGIDSCILIVCRSSTHFQLFCCFFFWSLSCKNVSHLIKK